MTAEVRPRYDSLALRARSPQAPSLALNASVPRPRTAARAARGGRDDIRHRVARARRGPHGNTSRRPTECTSTLPHRRAPQRDARRCSASSPHAAPSPPRARRGRRSASCAARPRTPRLARTRAEVVKAAAKTGSRARTGHGAQLARPRHVHERNAAFEESELLADAAARAGAERQEGKRVARRLVAHVASLRRARARACVHAGGQRARARVHAGGQHARACVHAACAHRRPLGQEARGAEELGLRPQVGPPVQGVRAPHDQLACTHCRGDTCARCGDGGARTGRLHAARYARVLCRATAQHKTAGDRPATPTAVSSRLRMGADGCSRSASCSTASARGAPDRALASSSSFSATCALAHAHARASASRRTGPYTVDFSSERRGLFGHGGRVVERPRKHAAATHIVRALARTAARRGAALGRGVVTGEHERDEVAHQRVVRHRLAAVQPHGVPQHIDRARFAARGRSAAHTPSAAPCTRGGRAARTDDWPFESE